MARLTATEQRRLGLVRPETMQLLLSLMDHAGAFGFTTYVPDYGGTRTTAQQAAIYADALRQGGGIDTAYAVAKPGSSRHEYGAAFDLHISAGGQAAGGGGNDDDYHTLADVAEQIGLVAGYYFAARGVGKKDPFHFQLNESFSTSVSRWRMMQAAGIQSTPSFFFPPLQTMLACAALGLVAWLLLRKV